RAHLARTGRLHALDVRSARRLIVGTPGNSSPFYLSHSWKGATFRLKVPARERHPPPKTEALLCLAHCEASVFLWARSVALFSRDVIAERNRLAPLSRRG